ncbi:alpha-protein kinase 3-like [Xenentodon cancila]
MGSRRTTTRSSFGNGRSSNGNDVSGNSRSSGCSYLSNVRPENRSTLCSVIAHLTEETQPSFVTTLKSKAVSENCNVKFFCVVTGYPVPQVTWYKDDKQLDRYCGLPKYEIFRNGEYHSLHIYNCTVEDAAIYQASAINSKGIVSCSGVLEVGEMNEFQIHQNYFAKVKQRSEDRRKETEGKENLEPLRTISPDRTQRKRRSTMAAFLSTSGSMEEESTAENRQTAGLVSEDGLQEPTVEEAEKKPIAVTHGAVSVMTNGQTDNDSDSKRGKPMYDAAHKVSTTHQPKTPFAKKKIKISNVTQVAKADLMGGRMSSERSAKDETSSFGGPAQRNGNSEVMEIENKVNSSTLDPDSRNIKEQNKSRTEEAMLAESPSKEDHACAEVPVSSQRNFTPSVPTIAHLSSVHTMSGAEDEKAAKHKKERNEYLQLVLCPKVAQTRTKMNRNDALNLEPPPDQPTNGSQLRQRTDDIRTSSLSSGFQGATVQMTQDTWANSRDSNESRSVLFTHLQGSPPKSAGGGENTPGYNVSPAGLQSQADTAIKTIEGTQIQDVERIEGYEEGKSVVQADSVTPSKKVVEMETETAGLHVTQQTKTETVKKAGNKCAGLLTKETSHIETKKNESISRVMEKTNSELQKLKLDTVETAVPLLTKTPENPVEQIQDLQEIPKPVTKVISIAELLRSQLKALESTLANSVSILPVHTNLAAIGESESPLTVTHLKTSIPKENATSLKYTQDEPAQGHNEERNPQINLISKMEKTVTEMDMKTVSGEHKTEEQSKRPVPFQSLQKYPAESESNIGTQQKNVHLSHQESSTDNEGLRSDSFAIPTPESSPLLQKRNNISPIPAATPQELASGARRKILMPKANPEEAADATSLTDTQTEKKEVLVQSSKPSTSSVALSLSPSLSQPSPLLQPHGETLTSPVERRSPLLIRRKAPETQTVSQQLTEKIHTKEKPVEKDKHNQFKAPQVIRKIRGETLADGSGHLKLWCQFFNILSDSTIKWYKNEEEIAQVKRKAGDETQANLAIVQASSIDPGVYGCSITNEYGTDTTDFLLSADVLARLFLREDLGVGEEIEMTPLIFTKGLADSGVWANKFFGRIMITESHIGGGCSHKVWRAKVIYGLEPVFESGNTCMIKVCSLITYGGKEDSRLIDRNLETMKQVCKIQNLAREYCKVFTAEARVIENFGPTLEVVPVYLMYRPANAVPYATVETDLPGAYQKYSVLDHSGRLDMRTGSEVEQKCCTLQHWIFQWTNGNLLLTRLEGVDTKITNVGISVKSTGYQGLPVEGNSKVFEQFVSQHKCNYFCGLLGLRSLKVMDSLMTPTKPKGSKSPLLQRKMAPGSSSPQSIRKAAGSPRLTRKAEQDGSTTPTKPKSTDTPRVVKMA